jgi:hypothetical protein
MYLGLYVEKAASGIENSPYPPLKFLGGDLLNDSENSTGPYYLQFSEDGLRLVHLFAPDFFTQQSRMDRIRPINI